MKNNLELNETNINRRDLLKDSWKNLILAIGAVLILLGLIKPDLSQWGVINNPVAIDVLELPEPKSVELKNKASKIIEILKASPDRKADAKKLKDLRDLYLDISKLISLDKEDMVVQNTEEIRQVNALSGVMARLDIKGKYKDLAEANKAVIVEAIGDDSVPLTSELRAKGLDGFDALAWAYNEGAK